MNKTVVWMGGLVVLAVAGFGGLVSWQASEVERFDGMTIPLPGDLVTLHVKTSEKSFLTKVVEFQLQVAGDTSQVPVMATWRGDVRLGLFPQVRLVLSDEDKTKLRISMKDDLRITFSPAGTAKTLRYQTQDFVMTGVHDVCKMPLSELTVDLNKKTSRWSGKTFVCERADGTKTFTLDGYEFTYNDWNEDDAYVGRLGISLQQLSWPDEGDVKHLKAVVDTTKDKPQESASKERGGVLATLGSTYTQTSALEVEGFVSPAWPLQTERFLFKSTSRHVTPKVFDVMAALTGEGALGDIDPQLGLLAVQDAFLKEGLTVDIDETLWKTNEGEAFFSGRLAAQKNEDGRLQIGAFSFSADETLFRAVSGDAVEGLKTRGLLRANESGKLTADIVIDENQVLVNGQKAL